MPLRIENAVDLHCHYGPDGIGGNLELDLDRGIPAIETAREALENGYAAIALKSHGFASTALAENIALMVPGLRVFGGICTDHPTGGLNVYAVEMALALGARIVWLPTVHSTVDFGHYPMHDRHRALGPVHVLGEDGSVVPAVHDIFDMVRQKNALLATGHISVDEHYAIAKEFGHSGRIVVTHAGESRGGAGLSPSQCAELADLGATVELTAMTCDELFGLPAKSHEDMIEILSAVGTDRCTLSTDYGWNRSVTPPPTAGFLEFLEALWVAGVPEQSLVEMASLTPGRLMELPFA
jgi:hypothetical protein